MGIYKVYFESLGIPTAALTPTFNTLKKVSDGSNVTPPSITEVGGGWYKFTLVPTEDYITVVDGGSTLDEADRYVSGVLTPDDFAATEARLGNLDAAVSTRSTLTAAQVNTEADTALADYDPPTRTEATADKTELLAAIDPLAIEASVQDAIADIADVQISVDGLPTLAQMAGTIGGGIVLTPSRVLDGSTVTIIRGDAATFAVALGVAWPLTGKVVTLCVKADPSDDNADAIINRALTVTDAANGGASITLTTTETATTGSYYAEIVVTDADGSSPRTAMQFPIVIKRDVKQ